MTGASATSSATGRSSRRGRNPGLLAGEELGFALATELNGVPGPLHVLDVREELALTREQV